MSLFDSFRLFDGATGTEYQKRGLAVGAPSELFTLQRLDVVAAVHREYADAGARVVETNTFGANGLRLAAHGLAGEVSRLNRVAVEIARASVPAGVSVAGSVGPLGLLLEPYGDLAERDARSCFAEQIRALVEAGIDILLIETMLSLREAEIACETARACGAPLVGVTLTFEETPEGPRTPFGESPRDCDAALREAGADFLGGNCGAGLDLMRSVGEEYLLCTTLPILLQPNAGLPIFDAAGMTYPVTPQEFALFVREMREAGIHSVGGCCGTGPAHIREAGRDLLHSGKREKGI